MRATSVGDVAVDLEHRLDRRGVVDVHRDVGREDVALGELAFPASMRSR